jgi:Spy/CpxP family protein refolding chaperone
MENTKKRGEAAVLVLVVFLLGALLGGVGNHLWDERVWGKQTINTQPTRNEIVAKLTTDLQLTSDQQQQLGAIVDDTRAQWRTLYTTIEPRHEQIRQQSRDRIRAILTPEQKPKFEQFMHQIDEQRKKDDQQLPR